MRACVYENVIQLLLSTFSWNAIVFSTLETCWVVSLPWSFLVRCWKERRWFRIKSIWCSMLCVARTFERLMAQDGFVYRSGFIKGLHNVRKLLATPQHWYLNLFQRNLAFRHGNALFVPCSLTLWWWLIWTLCCVVALFQILQECSCPVC